MTTMTPVWTEHETKAPTSLSRGSTASCTLDLRSKYDAYILAGAAKTGNRALTDGVTFMVRRSYDNNGVAHPHPCFSNSGKAFTPTKTTINGNSASGQKVLNVDSESGFAVGMYISVSDTALTRFEVCRIAAIGDGVGTITVDRNLQFSHDAADADRVVNGTDIHTVQLAPGSVYEIVWDYTNDTAGDSVVVWCYDTTYDSQVTV